MPGRERTSVAGLQGLLSFRYDNRVDRGIDNEVRSMKAIEAILLIRVLIQAGKRETAEMAMISETVPRNMGIMTAQNSHQGPCWIGLLPMPGQ